MKIFVLACTLTLGLSACSNIKLNSNFKPQAEISIRGSVVEEYSREELSHYQYRFLGPVMTNYCHIKDREPLPQRRAETIPSKEAFIRVLKSEAQAKGANAMVFEQCNLIASTYDCEHHYRCTANAYDILYH